MKRLLLILSMAMAVGCSQQPQNAFSLKGTVPGYDGENIYLRYTKNGDARYLDSTKIENGSFEFNGTLDEPCNLGFMFIGDLKNPRTLKSARLYIEPAEMTIAFDTVEFDRPVITGSFTQSQMDSIWTELDVIYKEQELAYKTIQEEKDEAKRAELQRQTPSFRPRIEQVYKKFALSHPDSYVTPMALGFIMSNYDYAELKAVYDGLSERIKQSSEIKSVVEHIAALERTQIGMEAPEFTLMDINGNPLALSSLRGKYLVLDFWGSWCGWCIKGIPEMKEYYAKYNDKLEILGIACRDTEKKWKDAVAQYELPWKNVINSSENDVSNLYGIQGYPTKVIIDPDGKLVKIILGESPEFYNFIDTLFK